MPKKTDRPAQENAGADANPNPETLAAVRRALNNPFDQAKLTTALAGEDAEPAAPSPSEAADAPLRFDFYDRVTQTVSGPRMDLRELIELVREDEKLRVDTDELRALDSKDAKREFKAARLPAAVLGCHGASSRRGGTGGVPSGYMALDTDDGLESLEEAEALRDEARGHLGCAAAYVSPSGRGVRTIHRVDRTKAEAQACWFALNLAFVARFGDRYGFSTTDKACSDLDTRLSFLGHDPGAWLDPDAAPFDWLGVDTSAGSPAAARFGKKLSAAYAVLGMKAAEIGQSRSPKVLLRYCAEADEGERHHTWCVAVWRLVQLRGSRSPEVEAFRAMWAGTMPGDRSTEFDSLLASAAAKLEDDARAAQPDSAGDLSQGFAQARRVVVDAESCRPFSWDPNSGEWFGGLDEVEAACNAWLRDTGADRDAAPKDFVRLVKDVSAMTVMTARMDRHANPETFDDEPSLLGLPGGRVLDLQAGGGRDCRDTDMISMRMGTLPDDSPTPLFDRFMLELADGRKDLLDYILAVCGYACAGCPSEEQVFIFKGGGANGKGTLLGALRDIFGSYAGTLGPRFFKATTTGHPPHPTELASLHRKRLLIQGEADAGKWDVQRIKAVTGDGVMRGRFMRQDEFDIKLLGVPLIGTNKTPILDTGPAMSRRVRVIPCDFDAEALLEGPDTTLKQRLRDEYPGIAGKLLKQAARWFSDGLPDMPDCVANTSESFVEASGGSLDTWFDERLVLTGDPGDFKSMPELFADYKMFAEHNNDRVYSREALGRFLTDKPHLVKGRKQIDGERVRGYRGVLTASEMAADNARRMK